MSFTLSSIKKQYNSTTETFKTSFRLTHKGDSVFKKTFDGSGTASVRIASDTFIIPNHFYRTGEPLTYDVGFDGSPISIDPGSVGVGGTTILPEVVYAIKVTENSFKVAAAASYAFSGDSINITSVGAGISHSFTADKRNTKSIIALDNIIQSPVYPRTNTTTTLSAISNNIISVQDSSILKPQSLIRIDDEIMKVDIVGFLGISNQLYVKRAVLGTTKQSHGVGATVELVFGDYNIIGDIVHFSEAPFGGFRYNIGISSNVGVNVDSNTFIGNVNILNTGDRVKLQTLFPPAGLDGNGYYFVIKKGETVFSLAEDRVSALSGINTVNITSTGIGTHRFTYVDEVNGSSFQGRVFTRSDYSGNLILDDISQNFTGIAKTYTLKSEGLDTTGITSDFGSILINNIFQKPEVDYDFIGGESTGITSIRFTGKNDFLSETYSTTDVNSNRLPRKGIIVSLGNSEGYGYQQRLVGYGTAVVSGFGTVTVSLGFTGSGYRNGPTTYKVSVYGGTYTTGAAGTFTVEDGHIKDVFMNSPGVGYTWTDVPLLQFDAPIPYDDLELISSSTGIGASVSVNVGAGLSITNFQLNNLGYGYTVGEQLRIAGIPTVTSIGSSFANAIFTVSEVQDDEFTGWVFGKLQVLDDFSDEFDGRKTTFTLRENGETISITGRPGSSIDLDQVLLIFINDILQKPGEAYTYEGGTKITFTEPPAPGSTLQIIFYRGTDSDVTTDEVTPKIKIGDDISIRKNRKEIIPVSQNSRVITDILSVDTVETSLYSSVGISNQTEPLRPVTWCKQQNDLVVGGVKISKSRLEYSAKIKPTARIIKNISTTDSVFYTDSGSLSFKKTEEPDASTFSVDIIDSDKDNSGFGSTSFILPKERVSTVSVDGDEGIIAGIGSTDTNIQFNFYIPLDSPLRENEFGGIFRTGISTGDYFVISHSNIGAGLTALSQDRSTTVGIATTCIDGIYQVSHIDTVGTGTMRVYAQVEEGHGLNFTGLGSGVGNVYGRFSWAKFTSTRTSGLAFTCTNDNGLTGISTAPQIIRTTKLSLDYS